MAFPNQVNGMNRMMYVEGNPVGYRDPSGNNKHIAMLNAIMGHMIGGIKLATKTARSIGRGADYAMRKASRGIDGAARQLTSGGKYSRNKGNDLDNLLGTGSTFAGIQNSNIGNWLTKQYNDIRRKPNQRGEEKQKEKDIQREERQFLNKAGVCMIAFAPGGLSVDKTAYGVCIRKITFEHESAVGAIIAIYSKPFDPFRLGDVSTNTDPNCNDPDTGISTPNCPATNPNKSLRFWDN